MDAVDLYRFIRNHAKQCSWEGDNLLLWLDAYDIGNFCKMLDRCDADDGGYPCRMKTDGTIVMLINDLCEEYDIDPKQLIKPDEIIMN